MSGLRGRFSVIGNVKVLKEWHSDAVSYERLIQVGAPFSIKRHVYAVFECECGNVSAAVVNSVKRGLTSSCGCGMRGRGCKYKTSCGVKLVVDWKAESVDGVRCVQAGAPFALERGRYHAVYECECGAFFVSQISSIGPNATTSCGCYRREATSARRRSHGESVYCKNTTEYRTWIHARQRCINPSDAAYPDYGGRGIRFCQRWSNFNNFLEDMGRKPSESHSLDRKDNDGDYCPENCRWATKREQANNRRVSFFVEAFGEKKTCPQWADDPRAAVGWKTIWARVRSGVTPEAAITSKDIRRIKGRGRIPLAELVESFNG